ncbi:DUF4351 domain-containing protein [Cyanobacterium aponinum]|uniref:DUF4351 domain-containing protein n=1 Tax=Cyanobacterium aponinum TaxID=379064 RepID=UPI0018EF942F|nr:DUF4351 domain-containing protein [Cyanobacterium aponinum]
MGIYRIIYSRSFAICIKKTLTLIKRLIKRRFNNVSQELEGKINSLSLSQIDNLADAIFGYQSLDDVIHWLTINT